MQQQLRRALRTALVSGSVASLVSLAALALCGHAESGRAFAPVNAPSHWLWGERALRRDGASLRYTAVGFVVHHLSSVFWGFVHTRLFGSAPKDAKTQAGQALLTTVLAAGVDLRLVPPRLTPGFERRLSAAGLVVVYVAFGVGLLAGHRFAGRLGLSRRR